MFILAKLDLEFHEPKLYGPGLKRLTKYECVYKQPYAQIFPQVYLLGGITDSKGRSGFQNNGRRCETSSQIAEGLFFLLTFLFPKLSFQGTSFRTNR